MLVGVREPQHEIHDYSHCDEERVNRAMKWEGVEPTEQRGTQNCLWRFVRGGKRRGYLREGAHRTDSVVIWTTTARADGGGAPVVGVQGIDHDSHG